MDALSVVMNYLDDYCIRSGTETISSRILKVERIVEAHQIRRMGRYHYEAYSRFFRGSSVERRSAYRKWDHAMHSPPVRMKSILKGGL